MSEEPSVGFVTTMAEWREEMRKQLLEQFAKEKARREHPLPIALASEFETKGWGHEKVICNNEEFCGKVLHFHKGAQFSMHFHVKKREVFWVQKGRIRLKTIDTTNAKTSEQEYGAGSIIEIPRLCMHQITALEETDVIEFSTHHEDADSFRVFPGDSQNVKMCHDQDGERTDP